jgi:hypothetical protein
MSLLIIVCKKHNVIPWTVQRIAGLEIPKHVEVRRSQSTELDDLRSSVVPIQSPAK